LHGAGDHLYHWQDLGFQLETVGSVGRSWVVAQEKEPGRGRVRWGVGKEWDWGVETRSFLCLGRDPGAPQGVK